LTCSIRKARSFARLRWRRPAIPVPRAQLAQVLAADEARVAALEVVVAAVALVMAEAVAVAAAWALPQA